MDLRELIDFFSKLVSDIETLNFTCDDIVLSDDICRDIEILDSDYAQDRFTPPIYGLLYPTLDNHLQLYVNQNQDLVNFGSTLIHEMTHFSDYTNLAALRNETFRELFDDHYFLLWTEFHASYISHRVMIRMGKESINCGQVASELCNKHMCFISRRTHIKLDQYANFCFRLYGEILALSDEYPDDMVLDLTDTAIIDRFADIFDFLRNHKSFESLSTSFPYFSELINAADN